MKKATYKLAMPVTEFTLENTLINGQCFNWRRNTTDQTLFEGIFDRYFVQLQRASEQEISVTVNYNSTTPYEQKDFRELFEKEYLNMAVEIQPLFEDWNTRDPKYFAKISTPL